MNWNIIIKLLLIIFFSIHVLYNFSENFETVPINWRDTSQDEEEEEEEEGPKIEQKYMEVAEHGYDAGKYNVQYHEPVSLVEEKHKGDFTYDEIEIVKDNKHITIPRLRIQDKILYNDPADYKYGITPYVPSYTDTVYLSSLRNSKYE